MVKAPSTRAKLKALENVLDTARRWQIEEAKALRTIRDGRLYRATHQTFEAYCAERWGIDRTYAHRQIQWAELLEVLPIGNTPTREAHARPLFGLSEDQQRAAWSIVLRKLGGSRTAATIAAVTEAYLKQTTRQNRSQTPLRGTYEVLTGDAIESVARLPAASVNLFLFSPPYAQQRDRHYPGISETAFSAYMAKLFDAMAPKLVDDGNVLVVAREHVRNGQISDYLLRTRLAIRAVGWKEIDTLIWNKPDAPPIGRVDRPRRAWEYVFWFARSTSPYIDTRACGNPSKEKRARMTRDRKEHHHGGGSLFRLFTNDRARSTDMIHAPVGGQPKGIDHNAMFPPSLASQLIQTFSPAGGNVADPFCGSGTTLAAAVQAGRSAWGNDIVGKFSRMTRDRLAQL